MRFKLILILINIFLYISWKHDNARFIWYIHILIALEYDFRLADEFQWFNYSKYWEPEMWFLYKCFPEYNLIPFLNGAGNLFVLRKTMCSKFYYFLIKRLSSWESLKMTQWGACFVITLARVSEMLINVE